MFVLFWWCCREKKIACAEDSAKNKRKSQLLQIRLSEKAVPHLEIITVVYLMCGLGYQCTHDFTEKMLRQIKVELLSRLIL